jgi:hypothetical protein
MLTVTRRLDYPRKSAGPIYPQFCLAPMEPIHACRIVRRGAGPVRWGLGAAMSAGHSGFALSLSCLMTIAVPRRRKRGRMRRGASLPVVLPFLMAMRAAAGSSTLWPRHRRRRSSTRRDPSHGRTPPSAVDTAAKPSTATAPAGRTGTCDSGRGVARGGLRISAQSWRRAGLGSNAQVTFTLRNDNDYAVRDVEIACAFARRDGSHLTDRRRIIPVTINMMSRKQFARLHVGFVNIHADRIKCEVVAASRV